jgi:hypothetical protein
MTDFAILNRVAINAFAEPVFFDVTAGVIVLPAIFDVKPVDHNFGGAGFADDRYTLQMLSFDVDAHSIAAKQTASVRQINYQILSLDQDTAGMTTLKIRRYE